MNNLNIVHEITFRKGNNTLHITKFGDDRHKITLTKKRVTEITSHNNFEAASRFVSKIVRKWEGLK